MEWKCGEWLAFRLSGWWRESKARRARSAVQKGRLFTLFDARTRPLTDREEARREMLMRPLTALPIASASDDNPGASEGFD